MPVRERQSRRGPVLLFLFNLTISSYAYRIKKMKKKETDKQKVIQKLLDLLSKEEMFIFIYLHGSFLSNDEFNDVDLAVYMDEKTIKKINLVEFEISYSVKLEKYLKIPVDVKILNYTPLSFRYHSTRGFLLFSRDDSIREEFLCRTWSDYFDFKPVSRIYLKEISDA
jgi:hypothetical protein